MDLDSNPPFIADRSEKSVEHRKVSKEYQDLVDRFMKKKPSVPKDEHYLDEGRLLTIRLPGNWTMYGEKYKTSDDGGIYNTTTFLNQNGSSFNHQRNGYERPELIKLLKSQPHKLTEAEITSISNEINGTIDGATVEDLNGERILRVDSYSSLNAKITLFVDSGNERVEEVSFGCPKEMIQICKPDFETAIESISWNHLSRPSRIQVN